MSHPTPPSAETLAREVDALRRQLTAAQRDLEAFMYTVSHDLRAPLRSLQGFSSVLLEMADNELNVPPESKARHYLARIQQGSRKISDMIDALLALSRISRADMFVRPVDFSQLCEEAATAVRARYPDRDLQFDIEPGMKLTGDARLLRTALDALFDNACKFTARQPRGQIAVRNFADDTGAGFAVSDNGMGFDMAYSEKLFQPFQRLHADHDVAPQESQGIGLATVQRIMSRHGGAAKAQSQPAHGATFFCTLAS